MDFVIQEWKEEKIYFDKDAWRKYQYAGSDIQIYLNKCFTRLAKATASVREKFPYVDGFYVSSTYRPSTPQSPHYEGRAVDVSRIMIQNQFHWLINSWEDPEWKTFFKEIKQQFHKRLWNQVLCPYQVLDIRKLYKVKVQKLLEKHKDHFHLNIPKDY